MNQKNIKVTVIAIIIIIVVVAISLISNIQFHYAEYVMNYFHMFEKLGIDQKNISKVTVDGISIHIQSDKKNYWENEIIRLNWVIQNVGDDAYGFNTSGPCDEKGIHVAIFDSNGIQISGFLPENALVIPEDDPRYLKFDSLLLYGEILELQNKNPDQKFSIVINFSDNKTMEEILKTSHNASKVATLESHYGSSEYILVDLPVQEIPKIADYPFVQRIIDPSNFRFDCNLLVVGPKITLNPGSHKNGSLTWSQLVVSENKDKPYSRVLPDEYTIQVRFFTIQNQLTFRIL